MRITALSVAKHALHWLAIPTIAATITLWPTLSSGLEQLQTNPGDMLLNLYFLEHAYQHFSGLHILNPERYWSPQYFWPIKDTLAWSDHLLGPSIIYGLFRSVLDPFQSYVGWLFATLWLNYISLRVTVQRISPLTGSAWLSIAALITAFSPTITQKLGWPQLLSLFLIGPIIWECHRLITMDTEYYSLSDWLTFASWLLANGFFNIYIFVYACYGAMICSMLHLVRRIRSRSYVLVLGNKLPIRISLLSALVALNLAIYMPYLQTLKTFGKRPLDEIINNLPKPASWFFGTNNWLLPPPWSPDNVTPNLIYGAEQELFPGWALLILMSGAIITALSVRGDKARFLRAWLLAIGSMVLLSLSVHNISAWLLISKLLPGGSSLRASSRIAIVIILFCAPAITLAAAHWQLKESRSWTPMASLFALSGGFAAIWPINQPAFSLTQWRKETSLISGAVDKSDCDVFWYEWSDQPPWKAHVMAMHVQLRTAIPTANGYSGQFPKDKWPYANPSGLAAFSWINSKNPSLHHRIRSIKPDTKACIVNISKDDEVRIRRLEYRSGVPYDMHSGFLPSRVLLSNNWITLATDHSQSIYMKIRGSQRAETWVMLRRDGLPMPADRGDYSLTDAVLNGNVVLITDTNKKEGVSYIWSINAGNGIFEGQTMKNPS